MAKPSLQSGIDGWVTRGLCVLFLLSLWLPLFQMRTQFFREATTTEQRVLAPAPPFTPRAITSFTAQYDRYFNDNFGFRTSLIRQNATLKIKGFHTSPLPSLVLGKEDWLFFDGTKAGDGISLPDYEGNAQFTPETLAHINEKFTSNQAFFAERGITFLIVITPSKHSIYPEYLPDRYTKGTATRLEQVVTHQNHAVPILDLTPALLRAKQRAPVYYTTDQHWNNFGAFIGWQEIQQALHQDLPNLSYTVRETPIGGGDLARFGSVQDLYSDKEISAVSTSPALSRSEHLLIFHDSFTDWLQPYIAESYPNATSVLRDLPDYSLIETTRPDIVIWELNERYLGSLAR